MNWLKRLFEKIKCFFSLKKIVPADPTDIYSTYQKNSLEMLQNLDRFIASRDDKFSDFDECKAEFGDIVTFKFKE